MSKLERLLNLVALLLDTETPLTAEEIRNKVEGYPEALASFRRSFERDKDDLRALGIPLTISEVPATDPVVSGYLIVKDDYYLTDPGFDAEELAAINLAALTVRLDGTGSSEALWKIGASHSLDGEENPAVVQIPGDKNLDPLFSAVAAELAVHFSYRDHDRSIEPWRLDFARGRWYVTGFDLDRQEQRNFRLDRISDPVRLGGPATNQRPQTATAEGTPQAWELGEDEPVSVGLLVDEELVAWASQVLGPDVARTKHSTGGAVFDVPVVVMPAFFSFVIGFLDHAEIVGPETVREEFVSYLEARS